MKNLAFRHNIIYRTSDTTPRFDPPPPPRPPRFHSLLLGENNWRLLWIGVLGFGLAPAVLAVAKTCFTEVLPLMQSLHNRAVYVMTRCWISPHSSKSYPNGKHFISLQNCNVTEHFLQKSSNSLCARKAVNAESVYWQSPSTVWNCRELLLDIASNKPKMKLKLTNCSAAEIHYAVFSIYRSGTKMADTQCAVKVKSWASINIMVCPSGCSTHCLAFPPSKATPWLYWPAQICHKSACDWMPHMHLTTSGPLIILVLN